MTKPITKYSMAWYAEKEKECEQLRARVLAQLEKKKGETAREALARADAEYKRQRAIIMK